MSRFRAVYAWFDQTDAHTWWAHYLINALGTGVGYALLGSFWPGAVLLVIYWSREVYQIATRPANTTQKWRDDLPDFISALLGFLQVVGLFS